MVYHLESIEMSIILIVSKISITSISSISLLNLSSFSYSVFSFFSLSPLSIIRNKDPSVLGNNLIPNEYIVHKKNGFYLNDNSDFAEITDAIKYISKNIEDLSMCSRNTFLKFFYYKSFKNKFKKLINHE